MLLQVTREFSDFHAVDSRTAFVRFDLLVSLPAVIPLADFLHNCSCPDGRSVSHFAVSDSVPSREGFRASLLPSSAKANTSWFFCRLALIESCVPTDPPYGLGLPHPREYYARC